MTEALQTGDTKALLLGNRELLSFDKAAAYLVGRVRVLTPLGASEFLMSSATHGRDAFDNRCRLALTVCELYRQVFPREYDASASPPFSTQREQEFYALVERRLFPLRMSEGASLATHVGREPNFFLPFIPVRGQQPHNWAEGCCPFEKLETVFKLALVLSGMMPGGWRSLGLKRGPSAITGAVGWSLFVYSCAVEETPLRALPLAINMVSHKTGNPWLDLPPVGYFGFDWSLEELMRLHLLMARARDITGQVLGLSAWLDELPAARLGRAIELWESGARIEAEMGASGVDSGDVTREMTEAMAAAVADLGVDREAMGHVVAALGANAVALARLRGGEAAIEEDYAG